MYWLFITSTRQSLWSHKCRHCTKRPQTRQQPHPPSYPEASQGGCGEGNEHSEETDHPPKRQALRPQSIEQAKGPERLGSYPQQVLSNANHENYLELSLTSMLVGWLLFVSSSVEREFLLLYKERNI